MTSNRRFTGLPRFPGDAPRRSAAAFILERHSGDLSRKTLADKPRDLEGGFIVAEPGAMDVGDAIALRVGQPDSRIDGEVSAEAVRGRKTRPLADQHYDHVGTQHGADLVAQRDPCARGYHRTFDAQTVGRQMRNPPPDP